MVLHIPVQHQLAYILLKQYSVLDVPEAAAPQEPVTDFRQRVAECNACIPYSGIAGNARVEDSALTAILSLLPVNPPAGANAPPPSTKEAIRTINILHCLQRLATSGSVAAAVLQTPGLPLLSCICVTMCQKCHACSLSRAAPAKAGSSCTCQTND